MTSYIGRHAEFYDLFYGSKSYDKEARFVHESLMLYGLQQDGARLLDLACGTGAHALHFSELGYRVTGMDYSPEMLAVARRKTAAQNLSVDFVEQDMRRLPAPEIPFDAAVCLFDSIGYVQTDEALGEVFAGVRSSIRNGGLFVFEFWHAPALLNGFDPVRVRRFPVPGGMVLRIAETTLQREQSLACVSYDIYDLRNDLTYDHIMETQINRYFTVAEMQTWAARYDFLPLSFHAGFSHDTQVTDSTWHVVTVWKMQ